MLFRLLKFSVIISFCLWLFGLQLVFFSNGLNTEGSLCANSIIILINPLIRYLENTKRRLA